MTTTPPDSDDTLPALRNDPKPPAKILPLKEILASLPPTPPPPPSTVTLDPTSPAHRPTSGDSSSSNSSAFRLPPIHTLCRSSFALPDPSASPSSNPQYSRPVSPSGSRLLARRPSELEWFSRITPRGALAKRQAGTASHHESSTARGISASHPSAHSRSELRPPSRRHSTSLLLENPPGVATGSDRQLSESPLVNYNGSYRPINAPRSRHVFRATATNESLGGVPPAAETARPAPRPYRSVPRSTRSRPAPYPTDAPINSGPEDVTVFATLWEDELTVALSIACNGHPVARRIGTPSSPYNNWINGTKLLNAAGLTRGKRDTLLKVEEQRLVFRKGPSNLKGVWVPLDVARRIARDFHLEQALQPLFDAGIVTLLSSPTNQARAIQFLAACRGRELLGREDGTLSQLLGARSGDDANTSDKSVRLRRMLELDTLRRKKRELIQFLARLEVDLGVVTAQQGPVTFAPANRGHSDSPLPTEFGGPNDNQSSNRRDQRRNPPSAFSSSGRRQVRTSPSDALPSRLSLVTDSAEASAPSSRLRQGHSSSVAKSDIEPFLPVNSHEPDPGHPSGDSGPQFADDPERSSTSTTRSLPSAISSNSAPSSPRRRTTTSSRPGHTEPGSVVAAPEDVTSFSFVVTPATSPPQARSPASAAPRRRDSSSSLRSSTHSSPHRFPHEEEVGLAPLLPAALDFGTTTEHRSLCAVSTRRSLSRVREEEEVEDDDDKEGDSDETCVGARGPKRRKGIMTSTSAAAGPSEVGDEEKAARRRRSIVDDEIKK